MRTPCDTFSAMAIVKTPQNAPSALVAPRARPLLPIGAQSQAALDLVGLRAVCELILAGHSQAGIGRLLGIPPQAVAAWSCNLQGEEQAIYTASLRASAEALLDEAQQVAVDVDPSQPGSSQRAKLIIDTLLRKSGIRNRQYRERTSLAETIAEAQHEATGGSHGQPGAPTVSFTITIAPQRDTAPPTDGGRQPITIEHDPG